MHFLLFGLIDALSDVFFCVLKLAELLFHISFERQLILLELLDVRLVLLALVDEEEVLVFELCEDFHQLIGRLERHRVLRILVRVFYQFE